MDNDNTYKLIIQSPSTWKVNKDAHCNTIKKVYGLVFEKVTKLVATGSFPLEIPKLVLDSDESDHHILAIWFFDDYISVSSLKTAILNEVKNKNSVFDSPTVTSILKNSIGTIYIPATSLCQSIKLVKKSTSSNIPDNLTGVFSRHSILKFRIAIEPNYFPLSSVDDLEKYFKDSVQKKRIGVNRAGFHFFDVDNVVESVSMVPSMYSNCPLGKDSDPKHQLLGDEEDENSLYSKIESCFSKSSHRRSKSNGLSSFSKSYVPGIYNDINSNESFYPHSNCANLPDSRLNSFDLPSYNDHITNVEKYKRTGSSKSNLSKSSYDIDSAIRDFKMQNLLSKSKEHNSNKVKESPINYNNHERFNPGHEPTHHYPMKSDFPHSNISSCSNYYKYKSDSNFSTADFTKKSVPYDDFTELNNKFKSLLGTFFNMTFKFFKYKITSLEDAEKKKRSYIMSKFKHLLMYFNIKRKLDASRSACKKLAKALLLEKARNAKLNNKYDPDLIRQLIDKIKHLEGDNKTLREQNNHLNMSMQKSEEEHKIQLTEITMQIEKTTEDFYLQKTIIKELQKRLDNNTANEDLKALKSKEAELNSQIKALTNKNIELTEENAVLNYKLKHAESLKNSEIDNKLSKIGDFLSKYVQNNSYRFVKDRISDSYNRYTLFSNSLINKALMKNEISNNHNMINDTKLLSNGKPLADNYSKEHMKDYSPCLISPAKILPSAYGSSCQTPTKRISNSYQPINEILPEKITPQSRTSQSQSHDAVNSPLNHSSTKIINPTVLPYELPYSPQYLRHVNLD